MWKVYPGHAYELRMVEVEGISFTKSKISLDLKQTLNASDAYIYSYLCIFYDDDDYWLTGG